MEIENMYAGSKGLDYFVEADDPEKCYIKINRNRDQLYFIQEGNRGPIKIGLSRKPYNRMRDLQIANASKLRMLWFFTPKSNKIENMLHNHFCDYKITGEWFEPVEDILQLILETIRHCWDGCIYDSNEYLFDLIAED